MGFIITCNTSAHAKQTRDRVFGAANGKDLYTEHELNHSCVISAVDREKHSLIICVKMINNIALSDI